MARAVTEPGVQATGRSRQPPVGRHHVPFPFRQPDRTTEQDAAGHGAVALINNGFANETRPDEEYVAGDRRRLCALRPGQRRYTCS
jgi:hypothetical protein